MNGHLDTVPVSDADAWRTDPFAPTLSADGRRLFGRGASDMKSSTGVMLYLMGLLKDAPLGGCLQAHVVCRRGDERRASARSTCWKRSPPAACRGPTTA